MPVVACPSCRGSVSLPDPPTAPRYSCPHCRRPVLVTGSAPQRPPAAETFEDIEPDDVPSYSRHRAERTAGPSWFGMFTANLAGALVAGLLLLVGVRFYLHWSVADAAGKVQQRMNDRGERK
jgi:hypothetical protein